MPNFEVLPGSKRVYLDHNATTPHSPRLVSRWHELISLSGNPSSIHQDSRAPKAVLRETRMKIAQNLSCHPLEVIFNSGASEGNSSVLLSVYMSSQNSKRDEFVISAVEHPSVMKTAKYLQSLGAKVYIAPVNRQGEINWTYLEQVITERTALVSVMYANNETGTIFPIKKISELAHQRGALMHSDCVQALGKVQLSLAELNLDYATFSAHKFYSTKGTGFCYVKKSAPWTPLVHGGGQERHRRGGTENIIGLAALNIVMEDFSLLAEQMKKVSHLRNQMENLIQQQIAGVQINCQTRERLGNTSSLIISDVDGETLLMSLDLKGFSVSTGAACSSGNPEPSPVLLSIGLSREEAQSSLRVSLGWQNTEEEITEFVKTLKEVVEKLRLLKQEEKKRDYAY